MSKAALPARSDMAKVFRSSCPRRALDPPTSWGGQVIEDDAQDTLTVDELRASISSLTQADQIRLAKTARILCGGSGYALNDLVNEAAERALRGSRKCPRSVSVVTFLANAMKSIVSAEREAAESRPKLISMSATGTEGLVLDVRDGSRNPEEVMLAVEDYEARLKALDRMFSDDEEAQIVIMADIDGLSGEAIRDMQGWNERELATVRRRIRRRIEQAQHQGVLSGRR